MIIIIIETPSHNNYEVTNMKSNFKAHTCDKHKKKYESHAHLPIWPSALRQRSPADEAGAEAGGEGPRGKGQLSNSSMKIHYNTHNFHFLRPKTTESNNKKRSKLTKVEEEYGTLVATATYALGPECWRGDGGLSCAPVYHLMCCNLCSFNSANRNNNSLREEQ